MSRTNLEQSQDGERKGGREAIMHSHSDDTELERQHMHAMQGSNSWWICIEAISHLKDGGGKRI